MLILGAVFIGSIASFSFSVGTWCLNSSCISPPITINELWGIHVTCLVIPMHRVPVFLIRFTTNLRKPPKENDRIGAPGTNALSSSEWAPIQSLPSL